MLSIILYNDLSGKATKATTLAGYGITDACSSTDSRLSNRRGTTRESIGTNLTTTGATSGTISLTKNLNEYNMFMIIMKESSVNCLYTFTGMSINAGSNLRWYWSSHYFNFVGNAATGKSIAWTSDTNLIPYGVYGII